MPRDTQQLARLIQDLMRLTKGRTGSRWMVVLGALALGYLVAAPALNEKLGWNLPVVSAEDSSADGSSAEAETAEETRAEPGSPDSKQPTTSHEPGADQRDADQRVFNAILHEGSNQVYTSPAGLRYTRGSQHGHRLKHLMAHATDERDRPGSHGVFDADEPSEVVELIDRAYKQALGGRRTKTKQEDRRTIYEVDLGRRIGYVGGESGARRRPPHPAAHKIRLVLDGKNVITAFPFK